MKEPIKEIKVMTRGDAIRAICLDCCCFQRIEVTKCTAYDCPLWPFRLGLYTQSMKHLLEGIEVKDLRVRSKKSSQDLTSEGSEP